MSSVLPELVAALAWRVNAFLATMVSSAFGAVTVILARAILKQPIGP